MPQRHEEFAAELAADLLNDHPEFLAHPDDPTKILLPYPEGNWAAVNLTPFDCQLQPADAGQYFDDVYTTDDLLNAYHLARLSKPFENDLPHACDYVSGYAADFMDGILQRARRILEDREARRIAALVSNLDIYTAVKGVESLLNSQADLALLRLSEVHGWALHFDHLAIRCGNAERRDADSDQTKMHRNH